jgi:hypothetical protein
MGGTKGGQQTGNMFAPRGRNDGLQMAFNYLMQLNGKKAPPTTGTGSKGAVAAPTPVLEPQAASLPPMPEYVNYQQTPSYGSQPVGPSQSILDFTGGQYASGGSVNERAPDDEIAAALRIVRLLGEMKKT